MVTLPIETLDLFLDDLELRLLPRELSGKELRLYVDALHYPSTGVWHRGKLTFPVPRLHPSENSYERHIKTPPYQREVAGGGYKNR